MTGPTWSLSVELDLGAFTLDVDVTSNAPTLAVIGPNGSGKTTLLRAIAGAHRPVAGTLRIGEHLLFDAATGCDLPPEQRLVGFVPQGYGLFPHMTVADNVSFGWRTLAPRLDTKPARRNAALAMLQRLGCADLADRMPAKLSGGERQRVALARALFIEPRALLLDEPLSALDVGARRTVRSFLAQRLAAESCPALVVTHDVRDVIALDAAVVALESGRVVQQGTAAEVARAPATDFVAEFFETLSLSTVVAAPQLVD